MNEQEIKQLLEKNLELTQEIYEMTRKVSRYIAFQKVMSMIYFLLIVVPIVLSIIYLPPLLKSMFDQYSSLLGGSGLANPALEQMLQGANPSSVNGVDFKALQGMLKK